VGLIVITVGRFPWMLRAPGWPCLHFSVAAFPLLAVAAFPCCVEVSVRSLLVDLLLWAVPCNCGRFIAAW
jgi:hypothetical protein